MPIMETKIDGEWTINTLTPDDVVKIEAAGGGALITDNQPPVTIRNHTERAAGLARQMELEQIAENCGIRIERG